MGKVTRNTPSLLTPVSFPTYRSIEETRMVGRKCERSRWIDRPKGKRLIKHRFLYSVRCSRVSPKFSRKIDRESLRESGWRKREKSVEEREKLATGTALPSSCLADFLLRIVPSEIPKG